MAFRPAIISYRTRLPVSGWVEIETTIEARTEDEARRSTSAAKRKALDMARALVGSLEPGEQESKAPDEYNFELSVPNQGNIVTEEIGRKVLTRG